MTSKAKDEPGAETPAQDRLLDSMRGDKIRRRAYEIYLERGAEPGRELEDWLQAERELTTDADQSSNRPLTGKAVTYKAAPRSSNSWNARFGRLRPVRSVSR